MDKYSTEDLINKIKRKGIKVTNDEIVKKYDYFQVINAYKPLFISYVEKIGDIVKNIEECNKEKMKEYRYIYNIESSVKDDRLVAVILDKIISKYGLYVPKKYQSDYTPKGIKFRIGLIEGIKFVLHHYEEGVEYSDFIRMYEFEHELRNLLLKYVLKIEENIKRVFISYLNDSQFQSNYLVDIRNYDTSSETGIKSIQKVLSLYENEHSKPIQRKIEQNLTIPFWILINEMTLKQTITTIKSLIDKHRMKIFQKCLNEFTYRNIDVFAPGNSNISAEKKEIWAFSKVLTYIGDLRNMLAHNQPIYNFNVSNLSFYDSDKPIYENPIMTESMKKGIEAAEREKEVSIDSEEEELESETPAKKEFVLTDEFYKHTENRVMMERLESFFGTDFFNSRRNGINIDLSWIIYVVWRISLKLDSNCTFGSELYNIYSKYGIYDLTVNKSISNIKSFKELKDYVGSINVEDKNLDIQESIKKICTDISSINIISEERKYNIFKYSKAYLKYTNIEKDFLEKLKNNLT